MSNERFPLTTHNSTQRFDRDLQKPLGLWVSPSSDKELEKRGRNPFSNRHSPCASCVCRLCPEPKGIFLGVWEGGQGCELQPTGATEPTSAAPSQLRTLHADSNSFALSSPGPNISPCGLCLLAALDRPPSPSLPSQHFNLSPLCRHPSGYKYRCQSSIPTFYPHNCPPSSTVHTMPQGVLPPIRDILPGACPPILTALSSHPPPLSD